MAYLPLRNALLLIVQLLPMALLHLMVLLQLQLNSALALPHPSTRLQDLPACVALHLPCRLLLAMGRRCSRTWRALMRVFLLLFARSVEKDGLIPKPRTISCFR